MSKQIRYYFGKKFYKLANGYWANMMPIHAHRWVWINHHGSIPEGMDIHHKDGDKDNNEIDNLQMLSRSDHLKEHWKDPKLREERRKFLKEQLPKVHEWLRSDEGRKVQSEASKKAWKYRKSGIKNCICCDKEFSTHQKFTKYCSQACAQKWKRDNGILDYIFTCLHCGKEFIGFKYTKRKFCNNSCGSLFHRGKCNKS